MLVYYSNCINDNKHVNDPDPDIDTARVINKNGNDPNSVTDTVRVINKHRNDPNSVIDTVRVINKNRNDPMSGSGSFTCLFITLTVSVTGSG
jgi:hypothetical protein